MILRPLPTEQVVLRSKRAREVIETETEPRGVILSKPGVPGPPGRDGDGAGDMVAAVYDPTGKSADAFSQDNMVDGSTNKNYTATEKSKLAGITGSNTGDQDLSGLQPTSARGAANGYAPLDANSLVPSANLPSYVDDVLEYTNLAGFPGTGTIGKIFVALDTGKIYRWSGSAYVEISPSPGSTDSVTEGSTNLYYTNARADARVAAATVAASTKTTPVNGDLIPLVDSAASNVLKQLSIANLVTVIKGYYDSVVATLTNKDLTSGTNTFPTFNQNTTGSAAKLTTSRNLRTNLASTSTAGFDGSADATPGVTGTLPVANGGTGAATLTGYLKGSGTSVVTASASVPVADLGTGKVTGSVNGTATSLILWTGTQAQYDALGSGRPSTTVYVVT